MQNAISSLIEKYADLKPAQNAIETAYTLLESSFTRGGKLLVCGNGGSASDSDHIVGELMKGFTKSRSVKNSFRNQLSERFGDEGETIGTLLQGALPAISLSAHGALVSAIGNDTDASMIYAQQVYGYGRQGDVLLAVSTSGNSKNVVRAVAVAKALELKTIGLTGAKGGELLQLCDVSICVPYHSTADVQERHLPIYHALCIALEEAFF